MMQADALPPRVLWLAREMPFPMDAGDRIYTGRMVESLARAGAAVTFLGLRTGDASPPADWPVTWHPVSGGKRGTASAVASLLPLAASVFDTPAHRAALDALLTQHWDAVVVDQLGSAWAWSRLLQARAAARARGEPGPVLVHLSHNHEATLWATMAREARGGLARRLGLRQNAWKTAWLERRVVAQADLVTTITAEDAQAYRTDAPSVRTLVLPPGYGGPVRATRTIGPEVPRRVVMVGSFRWAVKQENLCQFLAVAEPAFARHGIGFDVIGDVPQPLRDQLEPGLTATVLHGFVDDIEPLFDAARIAVVPELIGGGFKLKFLDYLFGRVPVATITQAAAGLAPALRDAMLCRDDLPALVEAIVSAIDGVTVLDRMQAAGFDGAQALFRWEDRGRALREAIAAARASSTASASAAAPASA